MTCSRIRKKTCIANDTECKWIVRKGCRRLVPITAAEKKVKSAKPSKPSKSSKSSKSSHSTSDSKPSKHSKSSKIGEIISALGPSIKRSPKTPKPSPEPLTKKAPSKSQSTPRKFGLEWIGADYLVVCTGYTGRIPEVNGGVKAMMDHYYSRSARSAKIVAIRDTTNLTWITRDINDTDEKEIYKFLKKYKIDGCIVIKMKKKEGVLMALGDYLELFGKGGAYKYCNIIRDTPESMRLGNSETLGRVMVTYLTTESE